jgi:hypothetical protein
MNEMALPESSPEKAGVGGSIPSLATTFSIAYSFAFTSVCSISFQNPIWVRRKLDSKGMDQMEFCPRSKPHVGLGSNRGLRKTGLGDLNLE